MGSQLLADVSHYTRRWVVMYLQMLVTYSQMGIVESGTNLQMLVILADWQSGTWRWVVRYLQMGSQVLPDGQSGTFRWVVRYCKFLWEGTIRFFKSNFCCTEWDNKMPFEGWAGARRFPLQLLTTNYSGLNHLTLLNDMMITSRM